MHRKAHRLALAEALSLFSLSYCVAKTVNSVNFCLQCQFSMHRGRQCAAPNGLPDAGPGGAPKGASPGLGGGAESFFSVVLCWQNVKMCECLLAKPSFQCIGAGSVPPPISCRTLGRAVRRKAHHLALEEAPILFFSIVLCCQNVKFCEFLLATPSFQCIGGGSVTPLMPCRTLGRAVHRKARRLAFVEAPILFFSVVLCWQNVKICECLLATPSFQCIGAGSVLPPISCRTLDGAARRKARRLALAEA